MNLSFSKIDMATLVAPIEEVAVARDLETGNRRAEATGFIDREKTITK